LGEPDKSGRRAPVAIPNEEEFLPASTIIFAIGQSVNTDGLHDVQLSRWKTIEAHPQTFATNLPGVFAIGDVTGQSSYAVEAISHGKKAAAAVFAYVMGQAAPIPFLPKTVLKPINKKTLPNPSIVPKTLEEAKTEAAKCLTCGCNGFEKCKLITLANYTNANPYKYKTQPTATLKEKNNVKTPQLTHDKNKCILCGLCIHACEKRLGENRGLLSSAHRGIKTVLYTHLLNSPACENCGDCAHICPTAAMEKQTCEGVFDFTTQVNKILRCLSC